MPVPLALPPPRLLGSGGGRKAAPCPHAGPLVAARCLRPIGRPYLPPRHARLASPPAAVSPTKLDRAGSPTRKGGKGSGGNDDEDEEDDDDDPTSLALFRWALYTRPWEGIAWSGPRVAGGMLAWAASFAGVGLLGVPLALRAFGVDGGIMGLGAGDKAVVLLANQVVETVVGVSVIRATLAPFAPLPPDILRVDLSRPFARRDGWLTWAGIGLVAAPLAIAGAAALAEAAGYGAATASGKGTADAVAGLLDMNSATFASLWVVTAILAPILEETVFRGFLLPSLTKWVPTPVAVTISALAFACAHLSARDFPQLFAFGLVLGTAYSRSRNLLTPMLMHGTWNGSVLIVLYYLTTHGVKVQDLVRAAG